MLTLCRLRGQSTRGVKTDIKQQTFRIANFPSDVLLFGTTDNEYLSNTRKVLGTLRENKVTANPAKTRLCLKKVEYVGHLISSTGFSFTEESIFTEPSTMYRSRLKSMSGQLESWMNRQAILVEVA